ncbi:TolC family protein [Marinobacter adhaerens]|uniref:TolC family protein n=1 Tax=Marinobacter adhaerens TaxID=1033846 RepID=A0A851HSL9_9GAMM|nr:TolC family protein [Marinobacter adhaerens]NWN91730.1 TolC family protein [Marinobacter adhaerens]
MRYIQAVIVALLLLSGGASALSLDEAQSLASRQATTLQTLSAETRQAEAMQQQSAQAFLPKLSADATWLRADSSLITNIPVPSPTAPGGIQRTDLGPVEGTVTGVQLVQPLFNADALQQRDAAKRNVTARRQSEQWARQALRLEVARRYFNILRLRQQEIAAKQAHSAASRASELAHGSYNEGLAARLDVEQADAELAASLARISQSRAATEEAEYQLQSLLGLTTGKPLHLSDTIPQPPTPASTGEDLPRKDLQARQSAVAAAEARARASRAEWIPSINLLARQQWAHGREPLDDNADGWLLAVNLKWTLFDGLGRQGRIAESRAKTLKTKAQLEETRRRIAQEQAVSASQWQAGYAAWQAAEKSTQAATKAARLATRRYQENIGSMTDLLTARARLDRERATLIDTRYQAVLAAMNHHLQHGRDPLLALGEPY